MRSLDWFLRLSILISSILPAGISPAMAQEAAGPIDPLELQSWLDVFFPAQMEELHIPGVTFAAVQDGRVLFSKAYGLADVKAGISFSADESLTAVHGEVGPQWVHPLSKGVRSPEEPQGGCVPYGSITVAGLRPEETVRADGGRVGWRIGWVRGAS